MSTNQPLVSIIMNCYNSDEYLAEAVKSVLNQTYQNWEIIFWDNQSTDESANIIKKINNDKIKYFFAPGHTPLGEARNQAIAQCHGEWIAFLDCDDIWSDDKLSKNFFALEQHPNPEKISLLYNTAHFIKSNGTIFSTTRKAYSGSIHSALLLEGNFIVMSSIVIRADILKQVGQINANLKYCEDYDLLLKITKDYEAIGIDLPLTAYRVHGNNITTISNRDNLLEVIKLLQSYLANKCYGINMRFWGSVHSSYYVFLLLKDMLLKRDMHKIPSLISQFPLQIISLPLLLIKKMLSGKTRVFF